jgi:hypothetical protein
VGPVMASDEPRGKRPAGPVVLRIKLRYDDVETMVQRFAPNVGRSGLFLPTRSLQPLGSEIKFELRLVTEQPVLVGLGRVKLVKAPDPILSKAAFGMAIELTRVTRESRELILRMLERRRALGLGEVSIPMPEDIDAARRGDFVETGVRDAASDAIPMATPAIDSRPEALLTAPRSPTGPLAVAKVASVTPLPPEPGRKKRPALGELIERAAAGVASVDLGELDGQVDVAAAIARARMLAGDSLDAELEALGDLQAAPVEISVEMASAELARQLGGVAVRRDRSAGWASPPGVTGPIARVESSGPTPASLEPDATPAEQAAPPPPDPDPEPHADAVASAPDVVPAPDPAGIVESAIAADPEPFVIAAGVVPDPEAESAIAADPEPPTASDPDLGLLSESLPKAGSDQEPAALAASEAGEASVTEPPSEPSFASISDPFDDSLDAALAVLAPEPADTYADPSAPPELNTQPAERLSIQEIEVDSIDEVIQPLGEADFADVEHTQIGADPSLFDELASRPSEIDLIGEAEHEWGAGEQTRGPDELAARDLEQQSAAVPQLDEGDEEVEELEEIEDFEILAVADAEDADLLAADGESEASRERELPERPSLSDFAARLDLGDDSDFYAGIPPDPVGDGIPDPLDPRLAASAGHALSAFDDLDDPVAPPPEPRHGYPLAGPSDPADEPRILGFPPLHTFDQSDVIVAPPEPRPVAGRRSGSARDDGFDLETALEALDVDLDDLAIPHASTELAPPYPGASAPARGAQPVRASTEDGVLIDFDDFDEE